MTFELAKKLTPRNYTLKIKELDVCGASYTVIIARVSHIYTVSHNYRTP